MNVYGAHFGFTIPSTELRSKIEATGWQITDLKFDKKQDRFVAKAKSQFREIERPGKTERLALANLLLAVTARSSSVHLGRWKTTFADQLQAIAEAYAKAPVYTVKASEPFLALAADCERRAAQLREHLEIQIVNDPEPYVKAEKMHDDVRKHRKLVVSRAGAHHPIWSEQQVVAYRICHDVLGYVAANSGWDWQGENEAFSHHAHLLDTEAQKALFTESIGVAAYTTFYHAFGPQKVAVFPAFMDKVQERENPHKGWRGMHPSQVPLPIEMPSVKPIVSYIETIDAPFEKTAGTGLIDPNYNWPANDPSYTVPVDSNNLTVKQQLGDPLGEAQGWSMANRLNRPWAQVQDPKLQGMMQQNHDNGTQQFGDQEWEYLKGLPEFQTMRKAVANAFRVALLSPQKKLHENAMHYQDLQHVEPGTTDPHIIHAALSGARRKYNVARWEEMHPGQGDLAPTHLAWSKFMTTKNGGEGAFVRYVAEKRQIPVYEAFDAAQREIDQMQHAQEELLMNEEAKKPPEARQYIFQLESKAATKVADHLQALLKAHREKADFASDYPNIQQLQALGADTGEEQIQDSSQTQSIPDLPGLPGPRGYPGWMYEQAVNIARVEAHVDEMLRAALEDVHNHDASGWHFRSSLLQLNIPGVGAKIASFTWLLLAPLTSQLATIDIHMMRCMGQTDESPSLRDYFGHERAFRARLDSLGYGHLPLGLGQWLLWDKIRSNSGQQPLMSWSKPQPPEDVGHQDHAGLAVLGPDNWDTIPWQDPAKYPDGQHWAQVTPWWANTKPLGDDMVDQYVSQLGPKAPLGKVPYTGMPEGYGTGGTFTADGTRIAGTAFTGELDLRTPEFTHAFTGERVVGNPGDTLMNHIVSSTGLSVPEVWQQYADELVSKN